MEAGRPTPSVTFVIPCFNQGAFVRKAVDSALAQAGADVRVVIVEDGSTDATTAAACDRCAGERVGVIHQENRGLPAARNRGARGARSEHLVFLDADDWVLPRFVASLSAAVEAERAAGRGESVSHAYCQERLVGMGTGVWRVPEWDPLLMMVTNIHPVTTLVRRECFEAVGGFDETMTGGYEDWDLWLKFVERGWRGVRVREPLFIWRRHSAATMIMRVVSNHEALFRRIRAQHAGLYERHAQELLVRTNVMLRQFDANWLDESLEPIKLRTARRVRETYESMPGMRLQRAVQRVIDALPRPIAGGARRVAHAVQRLLPGSNGSSHATGNGQAAPGPPAAPS